MATPLRIFTCTDHDGHYPVGTSSVIVARDEEEARELLDTALVAAGLKTGKEARYTLQELNTDRARVIILQDGNY